MGKAPKGTSTRKPPVPAESHVVIDEWMRRSMPRIQPLVERVDALIRETIPGLQYAVKWSKGYYGLPDRGWIIELAAYHVSANVVFFAGAKFDPPPPLGEGSRYIKLTSVEEVDTPEMRKWLKQAAAHPGWKG